MQNNPLSLIMIRMICHNLGIRGYIDLRTGYYATEVDIPHVRCGSKPVLKLSCVSISVDSHVFVLQILIYSLEMSTLVCLMQAGCMMHNSKCGVALSNHTF